MAGANQAAYRLHNRLRLRGHDSRLFVASKHTNDPSVFSVPVPCDFRTRLRRRWRPFSIEGKQVATMNQMNKRSNSYEILSSCFSPYFNLTPRMLSGAEVIQLNWVSWFLDWPSFFTEGTKTYVPLVWRLADANPLTGGCHYPNGCERFTDHCGCCPQAGSDEADDFSRKQFDLKKRLLAKVGSDRMTLVAQSCWMKTIVSRSPLFSRFACKVIRNGVDSSVFFPVPHRIAKEALGLHQDQPAVLFVGSERSRRKGLPQLLPLFSQLGFGEVAMLLVGNHSPQNSEVGNIRRYPATSSPDLLRLFYSAADLLLFPSLEDNCPNTILESLACGTPVLCFDGSGSVELIKEGVTGWIVPCRDFRQFAEKALSLLASAELGVGRRSECVQVARGEFNYNRVVDLYENTYREASGILTK